MTDSLQGLRILNTRPKEQAVLLSQQIRQAGGVAIECPTLEIKAPSQPWLHQLPPLDQVQHAIFISANAVHYCFKQIQYYKIHWPSSIHVIAIGTGSAQALYQHQIPVHQLPEAPDSEHLLALPCLQQVAGSNILLFKGEGGRQLIEQSLAQQKAKVMTLEVYQRLLPEIPHHFTNSLWQDDAVDIILLTSEQSIHHLFKLFDKKAHLWLQNKRCLLISERLAQVASSLGIKKIRVAHPNEIIKALFDYKD